MALRNKNSTATQYQLPGAWVENVTPDNRALSKIGSDANSISSATTGGAMTAATFWLSSDYSGSTFAINQSSPGSLDYNLNGPHTENAGSAPDGNAYTLYVADNKTFNSVGALAFYNNRASEPVSIHKLYVGSGASVVLNPAGTAATTGTGGSFYASPSSGTITVEKYGPGSITTGRGQYNYLASTKIRSGTMRLDGFSSGAYPPFGTASYTLTFDPDNDTGGNPTLEFFVGPVAQNTRTLPNPIAMTGAGTISVASGFTATFSGATSGAGTLTIAGAGTVTWTNNVSVPLNVTGRLTLSGARNLTSATIIGNGIIDMGTGTFGVSSDVVASGFTGTINNSFTVSGGTISIGANITGTVTPSGGNITFAGASSGGIGTVAWCDVTLTGTFAASSGTTTLAGSVANPGVSIGSLNIVGPTGGMNVGRAIAMQNYAAVRLSNGASVPNSITANTDTTPVTLIANDASTCTYSGAFSTNQASGAVNVRAVSGATFVLSGSLTSSNAGRTFQLNGTAGDTGTIRVTGAGISGSSAATLNRGTLALNSTSTIGLGTGLTVANSATVTAAANNARVSSPITLNNGATFKFAA